MEDILISNVLQAMANPGSNTFANVAIAGEMLHQAVLNSDHPSPEAEEALQVYYDWIRSWQGPVPTHLDRLLEESLEDVRRIAYREGGYYPEFEDGEQVFMDIDATLSVAAALWRAGRISRNEVRQLALRAASVVQQYLPYLNPWWQWAYDMWPEPVADTDLPFLTDWKRILGQYAPNRLATELAISRAATRELRRRVAAARKRSRTGS